MGGIDKKERRHYGGLNYLLVVLYILGIGVILVWMPKYCDDWWYMEHLRGWFESQGVWYPTDGGNVLKHGISWGAMVDTWREHILTDNSRLCNIVVVALLLLPKWIGSGIAVCFWAYAVIGLLRLSGTHRQGAGIPVAITLLTLCMPWREQMGALDYQWNYVVTSGLAVLFLTMVSKNLRGEVGPIPVIIIGVLLGAWQEAFSLPILAGLGTLWLVSAGKGRRKLLRACVSLGIGLLWLAVAPGLRHRIGTEVGRDPFTLYRAFFTLWQHVAYILFIAGLIIVSRRTGWGRLMEDRRLLFLMVSCTVPLLLAFMSNAMRRTGWWSDLGSIAGILILISKYGGEYSRTVRRIFAACAYCVMTFALVVLGTAAVYGFRMSSEYRELLRRHHENPEEPLFASYEPEYKGWLPLRAIMDFTLYTYNWNVVTANRYYHGREEARNYPFVVIPSALREITGSVGKPVAGNTDMREHEGYLVMPYRPGDELTFYADIEFGPLMSRDRVSMHGYPFVSEGDGRRYMVVFPQDVSTELRFGGVSKITRLR